MCLNIAAFRSGQEDIRPDEDIQKMFELPRYVISRGETVVEDGEIRSDTSGRTLHVDPTYDTDAVDDIKAWFDQYYTIQFRNYPVDEHYLQEHLSVPTKPVE